MSPYEKTPVTYSLSFTVFLFALKSPFARDNEALSLILYFNRFFGVSLIQWSIELPWTSLGLSAILSYGRLGQHQRTWRGLEPKAWVIDKPELTSWLCHLLLINVGQEDPLEESMTTHSSILAWRIPMGREAWRVTLHRVTKSQTWLILRMLLLFFKVSVYLLVKRVKIKVPTE